MAMRLSAEHRRLASRITMPRPRYWWSRAERLEGPGNVVGSLAGAGSCCNRRRVILIILQLREKVTVTL